MDLLSPLLISVGVAGAKLLAKNSIAVAADAMGLDVDLSKELAGGVVDWFKDTAKDEAARKKLTRPFEKMPETITKKLKPLFDEEIARRKQNAKLTELDSKAIVEQLCLTLEDRASLEFFLAGNLDATELTERLREIRPLGQKMLLPADTQFYHRALERLVPELITLSSKLPEFPVEVAKAMLNRLDRLEGKVYGVQQHLDAKDAQATAERSEFEKKYREAVIAKNNHLELFGADIAREACTLPLSVAYVTLNLQSESKTDGSMMRSAEALFDDLRPEVGRLLIRGEAGMGKSTLLRWAALESMKSESDYDSAGFQFTTKSLARAVEFKGAFLRRATLTWQHSLTKVTAAEAETKRLLPKGPESDYEPVKSFLHSLLWQSHIPFLIRLRDCPEGRIPAPDEFLKLTAKELGEPPKKWIVDVLKDGKGLILLDGVDEVRGEFRESHLLADLTALVKAYPKNYFVVSTRPEAVPPDWLHELGFREARINPMGARDREELIDRWHKAIAEASRSMGEEPARFTKLAQALKGKLSENPRLALLASNPLLCAMICALHERDDEHLPDREARLCERLCFMLLDERDRRRDVNRIAAPEWYTKLDYEEKKLIVRSIAYHMLVTRQQSVIDRAEAIQKVAERLPRMSQRIPSEVTPRELLDTLASRSGMLRVATPPSGGKLGTLDFIHNAFKEYLAAERLAEEPADGLLAAHAHKAEWLPVILFAAATKREGFATNMLLKILGDDYQPDQKLGRTRKAKGERRKKLTENELQTQQRLLLALRCLPVALDLDPQLRAWLEQQLRRMFPPRSMVEAEALASAGNLAVPFLKNRGGVQKAAASVRALRLIGTESARLTLQGYLEETSLEVLNELAQVINPLLIPAVLRMVQEPYDDEEYMKQHAIRKQIRDLSPIVGLTGLTWLNLTNTQVNDLSPLAGLSGLTSLNFCGTEVSDLSALAGLSRLSFLDFGYTQVSDLSPLAGLSGLTWLILSNTQVSDLSPLAGLTKLKAVFVSDREKLTIPESLRGVVREL